MDAAYDIIAEQGFEGLRTREVAGRAHLNISTLHYYFASKGDLVRNVAQRLLSEFKEGSDAGDGHRNDQPVSRRGTGAMERLRVAFADQARIILKRPATYVVVMELFTRSLHDRKLRPVAQSLLDTWEGHFRSLVTDGVQSGQISPLSNVPTTTRALQGLLIGRAMLSLIQGEEGAADSMFPQVARWLSPR